MKKNYISPIQEIITVHTSGFIAVSMTDPEGSTPIDEPIDEPEDVQVKPIFFGSDDEI